MHNIRSLSSAVGRNERLAVWGARSKRGFAKNDYADVAARGRGRCRCIFSFEHAHPMHYARLSPMLEDFQAQVNSLNWLSGDPVRIYIDSGSSSEAMAMDGTGCLPAGDTLRVPSIDRLASNASGEVEIVKDVGGVVLACAKNFRNDGLDSDRSKMRRWPLNSPTPTWTFRRPLRNSGCPAAAFTAGVTGVGSTRVLFRLSSRRDLGLPGGHCSSPFRRETNPFGVSRE